MTLHSYFRLALTRHGLWPGEADTVMEQIMATDNAMSGRWGEMVADYTSARLAAVWELVREAAVDWLRVVKPGHFALVMLMGEATTA